MPNSRYPYPNGIYLDEYNHPHYPSSAFSSIEIERGTSYPYARSFSLSVTATF